MAATSLRTAAKSFSARARREYTQKVVGRIAVNQSVWRDDHRSQSVCEGLCEIAVIIAGNGPFERGGVKIFFQLVFSYFRFGASFRVHDPADSEAAEIGKRSAVLVDVGDPGDIVAWLGAVRAAYAAHLIGVPRASFQIDYAQIPLLAPFLYPVAPADVLGVAEIGSAILSEGGEDHNGS